MHKTDFLSELVLLRNDPLLAQTIHKEAMTGNPHAQYAMGLIYAQARGVELDLAAAYAWLTLAVMQGDREAECLRNIVGCDISDQEFVAGKALAAQLAQQIDAPIGRH
jgi:TPR repeat protein